MGRNTQGVRIMNPAKGETLVAVAKLAESDAETEDTGPAGGS
jgi:hypothetical protein